MRFNGVKEAQRRQGVQRGSKTFKGRQAGRGPIRLRDPEDLVVLQKYNKIQDVAEMQHLV